MRRDKGAGFLFLPRTPHQAEDVEYRGQPSPGGGPLLHISCGFSGVRVRLRLFTPLLKAVVLPSVPHQQGLGGAGGAHRGATLRDEGQQGQKPGPPKARAPWDVCRGWGSGVGVWRGGERHQHPASQAQTTDWIVTSEAREARKRAAGGTPPCSRGVKGGGVLLGPGSGLLLIVPSNRLQKGSPWARRGWDKQRLQTCAREEGSSPGPRAPGPCWHLPYTSSALSWHSGLPLLAPSPGSTFG